MKNNEDILKKILLNMRYDSSKTLNENNKVIGKRKIVLSEDDEYLGQDNPNITTTTTKPVNNTDKPPRNSNANIFTKIKSCIDGQTFLSPSSSVATEDKFEPWTPDEWYAAQQRQRENGKTNGLDACIYYTEILRQKEIRDTLKDPNDSASAWFQKQIANCITLSVSVTNYQPTGCDSRFYISSEIGEELINVKGDIETGMMIAYVGTENWWSAFNGYSAYSKFTEGDKTGEFPLIKPPWESLSIRSYGVRYKSGKYNIEIDKLKSITDTKLLKDQDPLEDEKLGAKTLDINKTLPYKDSEVEAMSQNNVINKDGTVRGVNYAINTPWCLRDGVTFVNMRKSPGVNVDTGLFDIASLGPEWANFVAWKSNKVVGTDTGKRELLWLPLYDYYRDNVSYRNVYTRFKNENVNNFLDKIENYSMSQAQGTMFSPLEMRSLNSIEKSFKEGEQSGIGVPMDVPEYSIGLLYRYLEDTDFNIGDAWSTVYQTIISTGTNSGYRTKIIPPNTVVDDGNIMAWALDGGVAKYWLQIELIDKSQKVWVNQKNIEPCRLRKEDLSKTNDWDAEMKKAEMVSSGNKLVYKTKYIKTIKFAISNTPSNSNKTESELNIMAEEEWVRQQQDPELQKAGFKFIDDTTQHTSFEAERFRSMPILPMVIPNSNDPYDYEGESIFIND